MSKFDCVYRHKRILPSTPIEGLKISKTQEECIPKGLIIPSGMPCDTKCPLYASRYGIGFEHDEVLDVENN